MFSECTFHGRLTELLYGSCRAVQACARICADELEEACLQCGQSLILGGCACERSVLSEPWPEKCPHAAARCHVSPVAGERSLA